MQISVFSDSLRQPLCNGSLTPKGATLTPKGSRTSALESDEQWSTERMLDLSFVFERHDISPPTSLVTSNFCHKKKKSDRDGCGLLAF